MYFIKPNHCAIVTNEGPDVYSKTSGQIAPHGICALWEPNKEEIRSSSRFYILREVMSRPAMFSIPESIIKLALGEELANAAILSSTRVIPKRLIK